MAEPGAEPDLPCDVCDLTFKTEQGLAGHRRLKHRLGEVSGVE